jgi:hypothetical protein
MPRFAPYLTMQHARYPAGQEENTVAELEIEIRAYF